MFVEGLTNHAQEQLILRYGIQPHKFPAFIQAVRDPSKCSAYPIVNWHFYPDRHSKLVQFQGKQIPVIVSSDGVIITVLPRHFNVGEPASDQIEESGYNEELLSTEEFLSELEELKEENAHLKDQLATIKATLKNLLEEVQL